MGPEGQERQNFVKGNHSICKWLLFFRVLMTEISQDLDKEELASLAFLLMEDLAMSYGKMTKEKVIFICSDILEF